MGKAHRGHAWLAFAAIAIATLGWTDRARAGDGLDEARSAYDKGAAAYDKRDFTAAAIAFARADELVANDTTLRLALLSAIRAENAPLAMTLSDRARGRNLYPDLCNQAANKLGPLAARIRVDCEGNIECSANIDGSAASVRASNWVTAGPHSVELRGPLGKETRSVTVAAGESVQLLIPAVVAPPPRIEQPRPPPPKRGISPVWFWTSTGLTVALGGATIASGIDTMQTHDQFDRGRTIEGSNDGKERQLRTNLLLGGTLVMAAVTTVLGLFLVRWGSDAPAPAATVAASH